MAYENNRKNRASRRRKRRREVFFITALGILLFLFTTAFLIAAFFLARRLLPKEETVKETETETFVWETPETESESETETEQAKPVYPKPRYAFAEELVTVPVEGLRGTYEIAWVSDLHLITDHAEGEGVLAEHLEAIETRYGELPVTADGVHAEELWDEIVAYLNYRGFDAVIFGGDMIDYCSVSNIEALRRGFDALDPAMQRVYLRADHDYGNWYGGEEFTEERCRSLHAMIDGDRMEDKRLLLSDKEGKPEIMIVGVNDSTVNMGDAQFAQLEDWFAEAGEQGLTLLTATHIPYASMTDASLRELSMQVRNQIYYWNGDGSEGHFIPIGKTWEFMQLLYHFDPPVAQVLAGHLHASWDGKLNERVPEHIFAPAFAGNIGVVRIVPK